MQTEVSETDKNPTRLGQYVLFSFAENALFFKHATGLLPICPGVEWRADGVGEGTAFDAGSLSKLLFRP